MTDPGGKDIPCGKGRYKRTYAVKADSVWSSDSDIIATALIGALQYAGKYKLVSASDDPTQREAVSAQYRTRITLSSPAKGKMVVRGETECLPQHQ
ncbi:hypothetical protein GCM10027612_63460 [Microbispora bryophytorum subsp. camponoti]